MRTLNTRNVGSNPAWLATKYHQEAWQPETISSNPLPKREFEVLSLASAKLWYAESTLLCFDSLMPCVYDDEREWCMQLIFRGVVLNNESLWMSMFQRHSSFNEPFVPLQFYNVCFFLQTKSATMFLYSTVNVWKHKIYCAVRTIMGMEFVQSIKHHYFDCGENSN